MLKKLKKSTYIRNKEFVNLFVNSVDSFEDDEENLCLLKQLLLKKR